MIPYFQWIAFSLGPIPIHVWGLMVALGITVGLGVSVCAGKQRQLDTNTILDLAFWIVLSSFIGARFIFVLSEYALYRGQPFEIFKLWEGGLSLSGGLIGALIATIIFVRVKHIKFWDYAEVCIFGLPVGLAIGRLGCFFIFDHPGKPTTFFLGQKYIDGIVRHNHGLYLSLFGLVLAILFFILWRTNNKRPTGYFTTIFLLFYGISRFLIDFLRATDLSYSDSRFFHLTVAQYLSLLMIAAGCIVWYSMKHKNSIPTDATHTKKST